MNTKFTSHGRMFATGGLLALVAMSLTLIAVGARVSEVSASGDGTCLHGTSCAVEGPEETGGTWYWMRSPEDEKRVITSLFNRYCIRCHGIDGRGVWDIPDVPNFTNAVWQSSRSDGQLARLILEGRGAIMPPFRGTLTLEEAWAMARYLRTLVPGTEATRPDTGSSKPGDDKDRKMPETPQQ